MARRLRQIQAQLPPPRATLVMMVGLPGSGKSTAAQRISREIYQGAPIVNRDSIRMALHGKMWDPEHEDTVTLIERTMVFALLNAGHEVVILDNCNVRQMWRKFWEDREEFTVTYAVMVTPGNLCMKACQMKVPDTMPGVLERMSENCDVKLVNEAYRMTSTSRRMRAPVRFVDTLELEETARGIQGSDARKISLNDERARKGSRKDESRRARKRRT